MTTDVFIFTRIADAPLDISKSRSGAGNINMAVFGRPAPSTAITILISLLGQVRVACENTRKLGT